MRKKPPKISFKISLNVFYTFGMGKLSFMRRDLAEFTQFGITAEKLDALEALLSAFVEIPTDEELLGNQVTTTQQKDELAGQLRDGISAIMTRVENKYGYHSGTYRKFGISGVSVLDGGSLSYSGRRVHRVASGLLAEMGSEGLTQEILDGLKSLIDNFDLALAAQEDAIANRDIATENRLEKANAIYDLLVKYCETGKRIWENTNEAKYNDYVIYNTPSGADDTSEPEIPSPEPTAP